MKKLSMWGFHHKNAARTLIILSYIILNITGHFLGDIFHSMDIVLTPLCIITILLLLRAGYSILPEVTNLFIRIFSSGKNLLILF